MDFTGMLIMLFLIACAIVLAACALTTGVFWWLRRRDGQTAARWWRSHCLGSCAALLMTAIAVPLAAAAIERGLDWSTVRFVEDYALYLLWLLPVAILWWLVARFSPAGAS